MEENRLVSQTLIDLKNKIDNGNSEALEDFWKYMRGRKAPLIEEIPGDKDNALFTLIWQQDREIENIVAIGEIFGGEVFGEEGKSTDLARLGDTDLWYRSAIVSKKLRGLYFMAADTDEEGDWQDENAILDKFNPLIYTCPVDNENPEDVCLLNAKENILEMPDAATKEWVQPRTDGKKGNTELFRFRFKENEELRRVWIYTPYNYEELKDPCGLVVFTDGWEYVNLVKAPEILDNLIANGNIDPVCSIFIESSENRLQELTCNDNFLKFICEDILTWAKKQYRISDDKDRTVIAGLSLGGQFAAYAALKRSDIFGRVLSQSGAFAWNRDNNGKVTMDKDGNSNLIDMYNKSDVIDVDFYMNIGSLENFMTGHVKASENMVKTLKNKDYRVLSETFTGAHIYYDWQDTLADGINFLIGKCPYKSTYKLMNNFTIEKADKNEFRNYYGVYHGLCFATASFVMDYETMKDVLEDDDPAYWILDGNKKAGGCFLHNDQIGELFVVPPYSYSDLPLKEITAIVKGNLKQSEEVEVFYVVDDEEEKALEAAGYINAVYGDSGRWMIRPTEKYQVSFKEDFYVRSPEKKDLNIMGSLISESFTDNKDMNDNPSVEECTSWVEEYFDDYLDNSLLNEASTLVFNKDTDGLVGLCYISIWQKWPLISQIAVKPGFQGKGIGSEMIKKALTVLKEEHDAVRLYVEEGNKAEKMYRFNGFLPGQMIKTMKYKNTSEEGEIILS